MYYFSLQTSKYKCFYIEPTVNGKIIKCISKFNLSLQNKAPNSRHLCWIQQESETLLSLNMFLYNAIDMVKPMILDNINMSILLKSVN